MSDQASSAKVAVTRILIVEDDRKVAVSLQKGLVEAGFEPFAAHDAPAAQRLLESKVADLVLLDLGLPGGDGLQVLRRVREQNIRTPVIILTARDSLDDRVSGLDTGADDYLIKPFAFAELLARIRAQLRRTKEQGDVTLTLADLSLDLAGRDVMRNGEAIQLTPREFDLLAYLLRAEGETVSRDMLARDVWHEQSRVTPLDNVIDVHISHLRNKIDGEGLPQLIHTVRGVGYALRADA